MKKATVICFAAVLTMLVGCAALNKGLNTIAPNQTQTVSVTDPVTGVVTTKVVEIPGSHTPTPITADTAGAIPYGTVVLSGLLLAVNFWQKFQNDKLGKGLISTVQTIETVGKDPAIADAIEKLKVALANAHQVAGIQPLINDIIAKKT